MGLGRMRQTHRSSFVVVVVVSVRPVTNCCCTIYNMTVWLCIRASEFCDPREIPCHSVCVWVVCNIIMCAAEKWECGGGGGHCIPYGEIQTTITTEASDSIPISLSSEPNVDQHTFVLHLSNNRLFWLRCNLRRGLIDKLIPKRTIIEAETMALP